MLVSEPMSKSRSSQQSTPKRLLLIALLISCFAVSTGAQQPKPLIDESRWKLFGHTKDHDHFYDSTRMDQRSDKNGFRIWTKQVITGPEARARYLKRMSASKDRAWQNYLYTLELIDCDCPRRRYRTVKAILCDTEQAVIDTFTMDEHKPWNDVVPDSIFEILLNAVCKQ